MGIVTLLLLGAFSTIYLGSAMTKKPPFLEKALNFLLANIKYLSIGGVIYGLADVVIVLIQVRSYDYLVVRVLADALIVMMALPFCFDKLAEKYKGNVSTAILDEVAGSVKWVRSKEKAFGIAGAVVTVLMFAFVFR